MDNRTNHKKEQTTFWRRHFVSDEAGKNISWGAVIAGAVTFFGVLLLFSLITTAIGLGTFDPTSSNPMKGVGTGTIIWTIITLILSYAAAGFVAGLASGKTGLLHGFLTWGVSSILVVVLLTTAAASALGAAGKMISATTGVVTDVAGSAAGSVTEVVESAAGSAYDKASEEFGQLDTKELEANVEEILKDTDIKELQPGYLQGLLDEAKDETIEAGKQLAVNPENSDQIIEDLSNSLQAKADQVGQAIDRDAVSHAVAANTDLTEAEADKAVDNIITGYDKAANEAKAQIENAEQTIQEAKVEVEKTVDEGREVADEATDTAAKAAGFLFVGSLISLVIASYLGYVGSTKTGFYEIQQ